MTKGQFKPLPSKGTQRPKGNAKLCSGAPKFKCFYKTKLKFLR